MTTTQQDIGSSDFNNREILRYAYHLWDVNLPSLPEHKTLTRDQAEGSVMLMGECKQRGMDGFMAYNYKTNLKEFIPMTDIDSRLIK